MTTSPSFAQMANNQSISLSSALRANTPPTKGQTTSRKFLTLSIFFLLSFFCTTNLWGEEATISDFTKTSGKFGDVSYNSYKGGGTSDPAVNSSAIRLYQNSNGNTGGYIVLSVPDGYTITSATIKSTMATTTGYYIDSNPGNNTPAKANFEVSNRSLSANTEYTVSGLSTQHITFACFGTSSSSRLYVSYLSVTYQSAAAQTYNVTLSRNGVTETINDVEEGTALDDIDGTGDQGGCSPEWVFEGWSKTQRPAQNNTAVMDLVTTVDGAGPYYAVYSHTADGGGGSTTKTMTTFTSTSGNIGGDANVSYAAEKGNAGTAPAVNDEEIRIYQNGGTLTITGNNGKKLTSITIGSSMKTSVSYKIDGGSESSTQSITAGGKYTLSDINATSVLFTCKGTDKNSRLYLNHLSVTYSGGNTVYYTTSPSCATQTNYSVTYNLNEGTGTCPTLEAQTGGSTFMLASSDGISKTGYNFAGWNDGENTYNAGDTYTMPNKPVTFTAKWNPIKYTVIFDKNNASATGTMSNQKFDYGTAQNLTQNTFSLTGYTFSGWNTKENGSGTDYSDKQSVNNLTTTNNATITLYAQWEINTYKVTFNANGGTGSMSTQTFTHGQEQALKANTFTRAHYTFNGWKDGNDNTYTDKQSITLTADLTLYAQWTAKTYTITLDANGGTFVDKRDSQTKGSATFDYIYGTYATYSDAPNLTEYYTNLKCDGYQFDKWVSGGSPWNKLFTGTGDRTIKAQWSKLYSITLSENGTTTELTPQTSTSYTLPTELSAGTCQDDTKALVGWSTVAIPTPGDKPASNFYELGAKVTLTADQTTFYAVFATAEGVASTDYTKITDINNLTDGNYVIAYGYNTTTPSIILKATTKDETTLVATSASPSSNKYQNPAAENIWTIKKSGTTYTLYNETTSKYVQANTTPALLLADANPTNFNIEYSTDHWKIKINGNTSYQLVGYTNASGNYFQTKSGVSASYKVQLYKNTSTVSYSDYTTTCDNTKATITYDLNGGTGATCEQQTVTKGNEFILCNQTPTKTGYNFVGWTDGVNTYNVGARTSVTDNTKFYAAWTAKTIKITWDQNYTDCPESETSTYIYDGEDIEMPEDPIRTGYKFIGWYTASTDGTKITEVGTTNKPTGNVTYYAHWAELYTVTFMASGQVYVVQEDKYLSGANLELPADPSPANYACDGYIFDGWSVAEKTIEEATKPELITNPTITKDEIYYAVWKKATTEGAGETIFYESFNDNDAAGGNDGNFNTASNTEECYVDNEGWEGNKFYEANQCIKLGGSSAKGYITTPKLSQLSGNATLSFKAAAWANNSEQTDLLLSITGGGTLDKTSVTMIKGDWKTYEVTIKDGTSATRITFAGKNTSGSRFFLDEVKVTTSGGYNYTTLPSCGPTIVAKEGMWVTSSNGQSVKVNVPIAVKSFTTTATITGTSTSSNFVVTPLENVSNGINDVVEVIYTPTTANTKESTTITLTAKDGETEVSTTTFTLNGRSLPDEFVIVAQYGDKWLALPANMQSGADQYNGIEVTPNNALTQIPAAPSTTIYSLRGVADNRYEAAGTCVRLVGNGNKCLWGNAATTNTTIQNWTTLGTTNGSNYEWLLTTSDGELYTIANPAHPEYNQGRILSNSGSKYGLYKGTTKFYILPVGCSSQPGNIQVTARRVDATFSWEGNASSMKIDVYTNDAMTEGNISNTVTASPYYITGLSELTQYWFTMTPNGTDKACAYTGSFKTTGPTIDVVEWQENAAVIFVDKDKELNPVVVIDGEVEHGVGGTKATDIFFSKYFEAQGTAKLLAIYNGTANAISLADITILQRSMEKNTPLSLVNYGKTKGWIQPGEEIILYNVDAREEVMKCAEEDKTFESWNNVENNNLAFSGKGTIRLFRGNKCIDIIGAMESAEDIHDKKVTPLEGTEEPTFGDELGFTTATGDNYSTPNVETNYTLSTNRCLLVRKPSVTSGAIAVEKNIGDFKTLGNDYDGIANEWAGLQVPNGPSDNKYKYTCEGFQKVGSFDYNQYYKEYQSVQPGKVLDDYKHNADTKEYIIPIENLAKYSCLNLRFQLKQGDQVLTEEPVQVPIIVSGQKATNDAIFNAIVKTDASEPVYDQSIERCKTCNVVVLSNATLTKAADDATNDVAEVYNMKVYPGGQVVVPASTEYTVNSLAFRRQEDEVSMANIQGTLNVKHANGVYLDVRIDPSNWHYMTLPYDCRVGDVTFADGTPAVVNTDYLLGWYDGAYRAEHKTGGWTYITDNDYILKKGLGYIVALPGDGKVRREIRFPMANDVIAEDRTDKTVSGLYAYGGDKTDAELRPNHKGWNMIGSPYLYTYTTDIVKEPLQMGTLEHSPVNPWDGTWVRTGAARYIVEPIDNGWSGYEQKTIDYLKPFTSYFIQVGGVKNGEEYTTVTPETEQQIVFAANSVARNASAPRKVAEVEVTDNHPVWYGVEMIAPNNEKDNTTLLISNEFTDGYDMMDDLVKMRGDYYQYYNFPVLASNNNEGEMAFNALPDSSAAKIGVPLSYYAATAGTYTIATDGRFDLEEVKAAMLYDATTAQYTNLLTENYSFTTNKGNNTNRFTLFVTVERKKVPNITTGMDNLLANGQLSLIAIERTLVLSGLTENADIYVYDMNGKLITGTHTAGDNGVWRTIVPATGVYFVRVNSANSQQTLRTIVK